MNFIPEDRVADLDVPFFEDAKASDGWQGHTTTKTMERLQEEVSASIQRLGGLVTSFQRGEFAVQGPVNRQGFQIRYVIAVNDRDAIPGRFDVAALPVKVRGQREHIKARQEKSLKMALYMINISLNGLWFLRKLNPGFAPLMPWTLTNDGDQTITQAWNQRLSNGLLLTEGQFEVME